MSMLVVLNNFIRKRTITYYRIVENLNAAVDLLSFIIVTGQLIEYLK